MTPIRPTRLATAGALLLVLLIALGVYHTRAVSHLPDADAPFHSSDVALIGNTGLPQLVEFYHPA